jgi:hypothetical protein
MIVFRNWNKFTVLIGPSKVVVGRRKWEINGRNYLNTDARLFASVEGPEDMPYRRV